jgi:hypothetical protein
MTTRVFKRDVRMLARDGPGFRVIISSLVFYTLPLSRMKIPTQSPCSNHQERVTRKCTQLSLASPLPLLNSGQMNRGGRKGPRRAKGVGEWKLPAEPAAAAAVPRTPAPLTAPYLPGPLARRPSHKDPTGERKPSETTCCLMPHLADLISCGSSRRTSAEGGSPRERRLLSGAACSPDSAGHTAAQTRRGRGSRRSGS